jgi:sterol 24-C-methyltransferase
MAPSKQGLEREDKERDAAFNKALHGKSALAKGGIAAMFSKDKAAKKLAVDEYFKHFDNKRAEDETAEDREVCASPFSRFCLVLS